MMSVHLFLYKRARFMALYRQQEPHMTYFVDPGRELPFSYFIYTLRQIQFPDAVRNTI